LVKTTGTHESSVNDIGPVRCSNDEHILLRTHTIHLCEELIHHTISSSTTISTGASTLLGDGIKFIEEKNARRSLTSLLKDITDIGFTFSEPHGKKLWPFHRNKVGLAFICNGLCHEGLTATGWAIKENTLTGAHSKLFKLLRVLNRVLHKFFEITLLYG
jgi:hypothetical protein